VAWISRVLRASSLSIGVPAAILAAVSFLALDLDLALISTAFALAMLAIAISDARSFIVPDVLSLPAIPAGLLVSGYINDSGQPSWVILEHLVAAILSGLLLLAIKEAYSAIREREGLGLGDVKLAGVAGAWTGLTGFSQAILLASIVALVVISALNASSAKTYRRTTPVPFGAYFAPSIWLIWFAQHA